MASAEQRSSDESDENGKFPSADRQMSWESQSNTPTDLRPTRTIRFTVDYHSVCEKFELPDTETVGRIKEILETKVHVPADRQILKGLRRGVSNSTKLSDLYLSKDIVLYLLNPVGDGLAAAGDVPVSHRKDEYRLKIVFISGNSYSIYNIKMKGNKTIGAMKTFVASVIKVPPENQQWKGLHDTVTDETALCDSGIYFPAAEFEVTDARVDHTATEQQTEMYPGAMAQSAADADVVTESSTVEYSSVHERGLMALGEETTDSEALEQFSRNFEERYGQSHPEFFIGSLADAIRHTLQSKIEDRKLLALYLHHGGSIQINIFCDQLLCSESVVSILSENFVVWAWDVTYPDVKDRFFSSASTHFGREVTSEIRSYENDEFPVMIIISRPRGTNQVLDIIKGHVQVNELKTRLLHAVEVFNEGRDVVLAENKAELDRRKLVQEQDKAYQESLQADQAKAKAKMESQELEQETEMDVSHEEQREDDDKKVTREAGARSMPAEPPQDAEGVSELRFRLPRGLHLERRFWVQNTLQDVLDYLSVLGYPQEKYKLLTSLHKLDITELDLSQTLQNMNLIREVLTVAERF